MQWTHESGYLADDDPTRLDLDVLHGFLTTSYWSPGVPREVIARSIESSLCVGLYAPDGAQAGFARAVTDRATFAWIADVFVLDAHRGHGLGRFVVSTLLDHPDLATCRRVMLATADAHELYRSYGFNEPDNPGRYMVITRDPTTLYQAG